MRTGSGDGEEAGHRTRTKTVLSCHPAGRVVAPDLCVRPARDGVKLVGAPGVAALTRLRMARVRGVGLTDELSYAL